MPKDNLRSLEHAFYLIFLTSVIELVHVLYLYNYCLNELIYRL